MIFFARPECCCSIQLLNKRELCQAMRERDGSKRPLLNPWNTWAEEFFINSIGTSNNENCLVPLELFCDLQRIQLLSFFDQEDGMSITVFFVQELDQALCLFFNHQLRVIVFKWFELLNLKLFSESFAIFAYRSRKMFVRVRDAEESKHNIRVG